MRINGGASIFVLIIGVTVAVFLGSMVVLASSQIEYMLRSNAYDEALSIAEAGAQYYRWHLAHNSTDYQDGSNHTGPYLHNYKDPQGNVIGQYSLNINAPESGSTLVTITSTGYTLKYPTVKRTVKVELGIPSLAKYAFLHNSNVFFGSGVTVHGPVMSNGGIRQDGVNDSSFQSAVKSFVCGKDMGCVSPTPVPGIWGSGGPSTLWSYPTTPVDFSSVSVSFNQIKTDSQALGVYFGPSGAQGYHVILKSDQTADVYTVNRANPVRGEGPDGICTNLYEIINKETYIGNYNLSTKHIFFFEDYVWIEGTFKGHASIAAAKFPIDSNNVDIWINGSITYTAKDGTDQLGIIAQHNIIFVKNLPDNFELDAALMAQTGTIFRHAYHVPSCGNNGNAIRTQFTLYGSIISGSAAFWNYGTPPGSGFTTRTITHDNYLYYNPPPYFPVSRGSNYEIANWTEIKNP